jgi:3-oxoadipyl-CoA thiolase
MGNGPVPGINRLLAGLGLGIEDFGVTEINEAFASQSIACLRALGLADDAENTNPHGEAIALGHPLGMTGAGLVQTTIHAMEQRGVKRGFAALVVGIGIGLAFAFEVD